MSPVRTARSSSVTIPASPSPSMIGRRRIRCWTISAAASSTSILRGHFTMMLVVAAPEDAELERLRADLTAVRDRLELEALAVSELAEIDPHAEPPPSHIVTLYGADHPGIVHAATAALAERGVDVTDMTTKLAGEGDGEPLYALMMEIALPEDVSAEELGKALGHVGDEQGVEVSMRPLEQDAL